MIGENKATNIKKSIRIEIRPCLTNCHKHTFPPTLPGVGQQEIRPNNPFPFPVYQLFMHNFFQKYLLAVHYVSAVTDYNNYDKPIKMAVGMPEMIRFSLARKQIYKMTFQQVNVKTWDGHVRKNLREDRALLVKELSYRSTARKLTDLAQIIEIELSDRVVEVERVFPNMINLISDVGSILKVLVFMCFTVAMVHNGILFEKHLLNVIFSTEKKDSSQNSAKNNRKTQDSQRVNYTYFGLVSLKYCCKSKKDQRRIQYESHKELIARRMDILDLAKETQKIDFLSKTLFKPYQLEILSKFKQENDTQIQNAKSLSMEDAVMELTDNLKNKEGDKCQQQIDLMLMKHI
jgi:hypothetical protein